MLKRLKIQFDGIWVLGHREDEKLPAAAFAEEFAKLSEADVEKVTFEELVVAFDEDNLDPMAVVTLTFDRLYYGEKLKAALEAEVLEEVEPAGKHALLFGRRKTFPAENGRKAGVY